MFQRLKQRLALWLTTKAILLAYPYLAKEAEALGKRINDAMDKKLGAARSDLIQKSLIAPSLEAVAKELRA